MQSEISPAVLMLPAGPEGNLRIAAETEALSELLTELAERLQLPHPQPDSLRPDVVLTDRPDAGELPAAGKSAYLRRDPVSGQFFFLIRRKKNFSDGMKMMLFWQIVHAALLSQVRQGRALLMHGAILFHPELGKSMVIFGESGVGKTTAAGRFRTSGGESPADDRLLLTFAGNEFFAQPLPTWSRFAEHEKCDFARRYPVKSMALLFRGEDDCIRPADPGNWNIGFTQSIADAVLYPAGWLSPELRRLFMVPAMAQTDKIRERFGMLEIAGDLHGHLYRHLTEHLQ